MDDVIYADILFIINFSMDFLSLLLTSKISRHKIGTLQLIIASSVGAVFAVFAVCFPGNNYITHIINFFVGMLMCYIAFSLKGFLQYLKVAAIFYGVGFILGGTMTAFYSFLNNRFSPRTAVIDGDSAVLYSSIPARYFALLAVIAGAVSFIWSAVLRHKKAKTASIELSLGDKEISCTALSDSGNLLSDPISSLPVVIISKTKADELLPNELAECICDGDYANILDFFGGRFGNIAPRLIPCHGIGGEKMLVGFQCDKIIVDGNLKLALCAVCPDADIEGYDAVVPSVLC